MNILRIIDEIEQLVENGKGWMGSRAVNEEEFYTKIQHLRASLPQHANDASLLPIIDEIERIVENGKGLLGKRFVNEEDFFTQIQRLRSALPRAMKESESQLRAAPGANEAAVVENAQEEADRIIANARREAERILEDARNGIHPPRT